MGCSKGMNSSRHEWIQMSYIKIVITQIREWGCLFHDSFETVLLLQRLSPDMKRAVTIHLFETQFVVL